MLASKDQVKSILANIKIRCYDEKNRAYPSYGASGVSVCPEWHERGKFAQWYRENEYDCGEPLSVDKDILGGMVYSPETCLLIPSKLNFAYPKKKRNGGHTTGVQKRGLRFEVKVRNPFTSHNEYIGTFDTKSLAEAEYGRVKRMYFIRLLSTYEGRIPSHVYDAIFKSIESFDFS